MEDEVSLVDRLRRFVDSQMSDTDATIAGLRPVGVGRSRDNWIFDLIVADTDGTKRTEPLILRCDPEGGLVDTDRATEYAVLRALESSGLPTPAARWLDATGARLGRPSLIMRRDPGVCDYGILNGSLPVETRVDLARQFCDLLAEVHATNWKGLHLDSILADPGPEAAAAELASWERILRKDQIESYPELDFALAVLGNSAPVSARTVLVHGDFKPGNILIENGRVTSLLDWELAHLGDPLEDLGWVTQPLRTREHLIPAVWKRDDLVARYEAVTGAAVDRTSLTWWIAFSTFKTAVMQVSGLRAFLDGRSDEPYRPTRRVLTTLLESIEEMS